MIKSLYSFGYNSEFDLMVPGSIITLQPRPTVNVSLFKKLPVIFCFWLFNIFCFSCLVRTDYVLSCFIASSLEIILELECNTNCENAHDKWIFHEEIKLWNSKECLGFTVYYFWPDDAQRCGFIWAVAKVCFTCGCVHVVVSNDQGVNRVNIKHLSQCVFEDALTSI